MSLKFGTGLAVASATKAVNAVNLISWSKWLWDVQTEMRTNSDILKVWEVRNGGGKRNTGTTTSTLVESCRFQYRFVP